MYRGKKIAVVVPAYNEEPHIGKVLGGMPDFVDVVYVVDDASTDRTADIVRSAAGFAGCECRSRSWWCAGSAEARMRPAAADPVSAAIGALMREVSECVCAADAACGPAMTPDQWSGLEAVATGDSVDGPRIWLLQHCINRGPGAGLSTGYARALRDAMDIVVKVDGDNQMDLEEMRRLLDPIVDDVADYAKGDRTTRREHLAGMSLWRRIGNWLLCLLTRIAVGNRRLRDPQNGYTAISASALEVVGCELYNYYGYLNQMLMRLCAARLRLVNVAIPARYLGERSKIRYHMYIPRVSWLLVRLFAARVRALGSRQWRSRSCATSGAPASAHPSALRRQGASDDLGLMGRRDPRFETDEIS